MINAFAGGILIGVAVTILLLFSGRIAGNSGIIAGILNTARTKEYWRLSYMAGLVLAGFVYNLYRGGAGFSIDSSYPAVIIGGLLVGFGTRLGGGCTSGHGICGMARFSKRSVVATIVFMLTAILTVLIAKLLKGL